MFKGGNSTSVLSSQKKNPLTLAFTQGHRLNTRQNMCCHSVVNWHEVAPNFVMVEWR